MIMSKIHVKYRYPITYHVNVPERVKTITFISGCPRSPRCPLPSRKIIILQQANSQLRMFIFEGGGSFYKLKYKAPNPIPQIRSTLSLSKIAASQH